MASSVRFGLKIKTYWLIFGALILLFSLGYWFYTQLEWEEKEIDLGYSPEAKQNPFLAAEFFLRAQGIEVAQVRNLRLLENPTWQGKELNQADTIILVNGYKTLTPKTYQKVEKWIQNGGTFIISAQNPFVGSHTRENDLLMEEFDIQLEEKKENVKKTSFIDRFSEEVERQANKKPSDKNSSNKKQKSSYCAPNRHTTTIRFTGEDQALRFDFSKVTPFIFADSNESDVMKATETETTEESTHQNHLLYYEWGAGSLTFVSDQSIWSNRRIDCYDHAYALLRLINPDNKVWILVNQNAPSLLTILWRYTPFAVMASILALLLWLWSKSLRFGPIYKTDSHERRSLREHLHASAMLLWRNRQNSALLQLLRKDILERVDHQHIHLVSLSSEQQTEYLEGITGIPKVNITQALFSESLEHPQDFSVAIADLQTIRKVL